MLLFLPETLIPSRALHSTVRPHCPPQLDTYSLWGFHIIRPHKFWTFWPPSPSLSSKSILFIRKFAAFLDTHSPLCANVKHGSPAPWSQFLTMRPPVYLRWHISHLTLEILGAASPSWAGDSTVRETWPSATPSKDEADLATPRWTARKPLQGQITSEYVNAT